MLAGAGGHLGIRVAAEHLGQRALAGAVGPHDRVDFTRTDLEVEALEDLVVRDGRVQILDR